MTTPATQASIADPPGPSAAPAEGPASSEGAGGGSDLAGDEAIVPALELVVAELGPLGASFLSVGDRRSESFRAASSTRLAAFQSIPELRGWHEQLGPLDPLAPAVAARLSDRIATLDDVGGVRRALLDDPERLRAYRRIGAIDDVRILIREGGRLVATIALWRLLHHEPWTGTQLRLAEALQPLIEMAYVAALRRRRPTQDYLPASLTPRQREVAVLLAAGAANEEVARTLRISPNTVKCHVRAVLEKAGAASRRELILLRRNAVQGFDALGG